MLFGFLVVFKSLSAVHHDGTSHLKGSAIAFSFSFSVCTFVHNHSFFIINNIIFLGRFNQLKGGASLFLCVSAFTILIFTLCLSSLPVCKVQNGYIEERFRRKALPEKKCKAMYFRDHLPHPQTMMNYLNRTSTVHCKKDIMRL